MENIDFLKNRAKEFWERANEDFSKKRYNLAVFDVEQALQLWFKHLIFLKSGDFPKTHQFDILIKEIAQIYNKDEILKFYKDNAIKFKAVEDCYITSRYILREFNEDETKEIIKFAEEVFKFFEEKLNEKFV